MANIKISELSSAAPITGSEYIEIVQHGLSKKIAVNDLAVSKVSGSLPTSVSPMYLLTHIDGDQTLYQATAITCDYNANVYATSSWMNMTNFKTMLSQSLGL